MRMPALTDVNKLQRFLSECIDPSRTLRHDTACFHVPPMDDRSEGRINGCTRDGCNSFLIACRRRKLNCLSLTFALALSLAHWVATHVVTIHVQVWSWIRARSRYSSCLFVLIDEGFRNTTERHRHLTRTVLWGCRRSLRWARLEPTSVVPRAVLVRHTLIRSTRKVEQRNVA